jgi:VIT1/CCC1 family predicted Fe2+/Mn2+ transporter
MDINKFSIGATAAITTSMGLIAGLAHGESSRISIVTGLLVIAFADNISDSLGIHIYKESEGASKSDIRSSTFGNFFVRLVLALTFVLFVLLLPSNLALIVSSIWGLALLAVLSYLIARRKNTRPTWEIAWHLAVALFVIAVSKLVGHLIATRLR